MSTRALTCANSAQDGEPSPHFLLVCDLTRRLLMWFSVPKRDTVRIPTARVPGRQPASSTATRAALAQPDSVSSTGFGVFSEGCPARDRQSVMAKGATAVRPRSVGAGARKGTRPFRPGARGSATPVRTSAGVARTTRSNPPGGPGRHLEVMPGSMGGSACQVARLSRLVSVRVARVVAACRRGPRAGCRRRTRPRVRRGCHRPRPAP